MAVFDEAAKRRLGEVEGAPADADADWLMEVVEAALAVGGEDEALIKRAVYALARVGPWRRRAVVEWLGALATGPHRAQWGSAAVGTAVSVPEDPACRARLLELAADDRVTAAGRVMLAVSAGPAGVPVLARALPEVEWRSAGLLRDVQGVLLASPPGDPDPLALLNAQYERVGWVTRAVLLDDISAGVAEPARVAAWLVKLGRRGDPTTRRAAAAALGRLGHPAARAWLEARLADDHPGVRTAARAALDRLAPGDAPEVDAGAVPGDRGPLPTRCPEWAALQPAPRWVPVAFWLDRAMRGGGASTWIPWTLIGVGGVAQWLSPVDNLARVALTFGWLWHIVALPVSIVVAVREVRQVRRGFATLGEVGAPQQRVSVRRVRGSTIRVKWHDLPVELLGEDGRLHTAKMHFDRPLAAGTAPEPVLHAPGDPTQVAILRALDALRVDRHGHLRFGWRWRGVLAVGMVVAAVASSVHLLLCALA